jgi:hypothetical protein
VSRAIRGELGERIRVQILAAAGSAGIRVQILAAASAHPGSRRILAARRAHPCSGLSGHPGEAADAGGWCGAASAGG